VAPIARVAFTPCSCARFYCQTSFRAEDPKKQYERHRQLADLARSSLKAHASNNPEFAIMLGWFDSQDHSMSVLWNWLADQHEYHRHLTAKYEGGIFQYLRRAFRDEFIHAPAILDKDS
jgi:hypothetical protein